MLDKQINKSFLISFIFVLFMLISALAQIPMHSQDETQRLLNEVVLSHPRRSITWPKLARLPAIVTHNTASRPCPMPYENESGSALPRRRLRPPASEYPMLKTPATVNAKSNGTARLKPTVGRIPVIRIRIETRNCP